MLVRDLFSLFTGVERIVDATAGPEGLRRHLMVPDAVPFATADAEVTPGTLVLCSTGPGLGDLLQALPLGTEALILCGDAVSRREVLEELNLGLARLSHALPVDHSGRYGIQAALIAERVAEVESEVPGADTVATRLWIANQLVLGDLVTLPLRDRAQALGDRANLLAADLAAARADAEAARTKLARARKRMSAVEGSASYRLTRTLVDGVKHPHEVPRNVAAIWRDRRSAQPPARPVATHRTVPIPLPVTPPRTLTMTAPADLLVPRKLAENGLAGYEPSAVPCFLAAIGAAGPGAVLDIGANVGLYAALAAGVTGRETVAFEPFPVLVGVVERVAADNDLAIRVESIALSDHSGQATFYLSDSSDSSNSLAAGFRESTRQIEVAVETLDAYVGRTGIVPAVLKIDTESTEPDVLLGAAGTLREHRPWVLCEVLHGRGEDRLMEALAPHGYRWYHITDEVPYRDARLIKGDRTYQDLMWLFAPEEPDESFWSAVADYRARLGGDLPLLVGAGHADRDG